MRTQLYPIDAVQIIDSIAADLTVAVEVWRGTRWQLWPKGSEKTEIVVDRVLISSVILSLAKYLEFYRMYQSIFPSQSEAATHAEKIHNNLSASSIQKFRDKYVGHVWDRAEKRPLRESEVQEILKEVMGDNRTAFIEWVHNEAGNRFPETVVSVLEKLRDELTLSHGINPDDVYSR